MADWSRASLLRGLALVACILHVTAARSDETAAPSTAAGTAGAAGGVGLGVGAAPTTCPADMREVEGTFCPFLDQICIKRPQQMSYRCSEYRAPSGNCQTGTSQKHFCIDDYEWPNKVGETPVVMKSWYDARDACQGVGKRLCSEDEWTLACEGPEHLPYPYGYARDDKACNIDKPAIQVNEEALRRPDRRAAEAARLWQGEASGSREKCVSPFGVHDMTGNVDEWTVNEKGVPHHSALKGGYWSWVRGRCRAVTEGHDEGFKYYQIGWRCCTNPTPGGTKRAPETRAPEMRAPERPRVTTGEASSPPPPPPEAARRFADDTPREGVKGREKGSIVIPANASGHRVFVDERILGASESGPFVIDCGMHTIRIGHDGRDQKVDVPCGGRVVLSYP